MKLFELFATSSAASLAARWPRGLQPDAAAPAGPAALATWLQQLDDGVDVTDVRTGASGGRIGVEARLSLDNSRTTRPSGFPFVFSSMPEVEFRIQTIASPSVRLFASVSDRGTEVVLEGLPVEIVLPSHLVHPPPDPQGLPGPTETVGSFTPGQLDHLQIVYRSVSGTSVFVHIRLHMDEDGQFSIRTAVPISFGRCVFAFLLCQAVHDFRLVPSAAVARRGVEWLRHPVGAIDPRAPDGLFAARTLHLDPSGWPLNEATDWLRRHSDQEPNAEFVLEDVAAPFSTFFLLPVPSHVTAGIRRRVIDPSDVAQIFAFEQAPLVIRSTREPESGVSIESLFYRSMPLAKDLGLTFSAGLIYDKDKSDPYAFELGLAEDYTVRLGYRRGFDPQGNPAEGSPGLPSVNRLLHWGVEKLGVDVDVMAFRAGYSLGRAFKDGKGFKDCVEATVDLFVRSKPWTTGKDGFHAELSALDGQEVRFAVEGVGWRDGRLHLEGAEVPEGVTFSAGWGAGLQLKLIIEELGLRGEQGATYLSWSGGVAIDVPASLTGELTFKRLRVKVRGSTRAPTILLDGFFAQFSSAKVAIAVGGYYRDEQVGAARVREVGLTGTVALRLPSVRYGLSLDFLLGSVTETGKPTFVYFLHQFALEGVAIIPQGYEARALRGLFASGMAPKLRQEDLDSRELRYFNWYRAFNAAELPGSRRLQGWQAAQGAWAAGAGLRVSAAGMGTVARLELFLMLVNGRSEQGLLLGGGLSILKNQEAVGYLALEAALSGGLLRFSAVLQIETKISKLVSEAPQFLDQVGKLTGTVFIGNRPSTLAIGRLADQRTWLTASLDINLYVQRHAFLLAFGLEWVGQPGGPKGAGLAVRFEGGMNVDLVALTYQAGFGLLISFFKTCSADYAAVAYAEAGVRLVVLKIFRFGVGARADARLVGTTPTMLEWKLVLKLEMPWYMPNIVLSLGTTKGTVAPEKLRCSTSPLQGASARDELKGDGLPAHVERFDQSWDGLAAPDTFSIENLRGPGVTAEAPRIQRFDDDEDARPVPLNATLAVEWSVPVNDKLGLSPTVAAGLGDQKSGDLLLRYDLVGIAVRRRSRFGADRSWHGLESRVEAGPDFSDPQGVKLKGGFGPEILAKHWALDVQVDGRAAAKKLLINSSTPFDFQTLNQEVDEEAARQHPDWPCCSTESAQLRHSSEHHVSFEMDPPGASLKAARLFTNSQSRLAFLQPAHVRAASFAGVTPGPHSAAVPVASLGPVLSADLDEEAAFCGVSVACPAPISMILLAWNSAGDLAGAKQLTLSGGPGFQRLTVAASSPIRSFELGLAYTAASSPMTVGSHVQPGVVFELEVERVGYVALREYLEALQRDESCAAVTGPARAAYEGKGKLFFLPNHDYEVALTTRVTVTHPTKPAESADVGEYVYFRTKGLPGLNAASRVGEELEPFVRSTYTGGRGVLYREEPAVLAFNEDFSVAVPTQLRPPGSSAEHTQLLRMQLLVRPDIAVEQQTVFTATGNDWVVAHRAPPPAVLQTDWKSASTYSKTLTTRTTSGSPHRARLAALTQRPGSQCPVSDPLRVLGPVLVAPPQGQVDPLDPSRQLWPAAGSCTATVRLEGAPFVQRLAFDSTDETAFTRVTDSGGGDTTAWTVVSGELRAATGAMRRLALFGEPSWNHVTVDVAFKPGSGTAGIGVALPAPGKVPDRGMFAVVEPTAGGRRLAIYRRLAGTQFQLVAQTAITAAGPPSADVRLRVTAFDDRLRAAVGDEVVEADRQELREGCLCLLAQGAVAFTSLEVAGIEMYRFPFRVSRFRSFADHVTSFSGTVDRLQPDMLGAGTTSSSVAALWQAMGSEVQAAMEPASPPSRRQALFDHWVRELGLPLKQEVASLEVSRFEVGGRSALLLLESPEPLDFTEEVTVRLERRDLVSTGPGSKHHPPHGDVHQRHAPAAEGPMIRSVMRVGEGIHVELDSDAPDWARRALVFLEKVAPRHLRAYSGLGEQFDATSPTLVRARATDELLTSSGGPSTFVSAELESLPEGTIVAVTADFKRVLSKFNAASYTYVPVDVRVLQDGQGRRALILPFSGGSPLGLKSGTYRITLVIDRARWSTTDPPDDTNRYRREASFGAVL